MILKIDTEFLQKHKFSINQYFILAILYEHKDDYKQLFTLISDNTLEEDLALLEAKGYITSELDNNANMVYKVTDSYIQLVEVPVIRFFNQLWNTYPRKVPGRNGGFRFLRAEGLESKDAEKCLKKYESIVRSKPWLLYTIQQGLENQLELERVANGLQYMQEFETWLNNCTWEKYLDLNDEKTKSNERYDSV